MSRRSRSLYHVAALMLCALAQGVWIGATWHSAEHVFEDCHAQPQRRGCCVRHKSAASASLIQSVKPTCRLCEFASVQIDAPTLVNVFPPLLEAMPSEQIAPAGLNFVSSMCLPWGRAPPPTAA